MVKNRAKVFSSMPMVPNTMVSLKKAKRMGKESKLSLMEVSTKVNMSKISLRAKARSTGPMAPNTSVRLRTTRRMGEACAPLLMAINQV